MSDTRLKCLLTAKGDSAGQNYRVAPHPHRQNGTEFSTRDVQSLDLTHDFQEQVLHQFRSRTPQRGSTLPISCSSNLVSCLSRALKSRRKSTRSHAPLECPPRLSSVTASLAPFGGSPEGLSKIASTLETNLHSEGIAVLHSLVPHLTLHPACILLIAYNNKVKEKRSHIVSRTQDEEETPWPKCPQRQLDLSMLSNPHNQLR